MSHDVAIEILKLATQMQEQSRYRINVFVIAGLHTLEGFIDFAFIENNLIELRLKGRQPVRMGFSKGMVYKLLCNEFTHRLRSADDSPIEIDFLYLDLVRGIQKDTGSRWSFCKRKNLVTTRCLQASGPIAQVLSSEFKEAVDQFEEWAHGMASCICNNRARLF
jgi:hypothetical protein